MKDKRTEAKPAKDERPDRRYEEPFEDQCGRAPAQDKRDPNQ
jgi:hypothetical protein